METIEAKVLIFFKKKFILSKISKNTIINEKIIMEDEVDQELIEFFEKFSILPNNFNILHYFYPEPMPSWKYFWNKVRGRIKYPPKPPLTIGHLIKVAEKGEWFEPEE